MRNTNGKPKHSKLGTKMAFAIYATSHLNYKQRKPLPTLAAKTVQVQEERLSENIREIWLRQHSCVHPLVRKPRDTIYKYQRLE
nr:hypothetical protein [Halomonas socia]